jgi:hypothetical protein
MKVGVKCCRMWKPEPAVYSQKERKKERNEEEVNQES